MGRRQEALLGLDVLQGLVPGRARRFLDDGQIFLVAEALILVLALVLAVLRTLPGPVFFPVRALAILYTDFFRGLPSILVIYILGFGVPALGIEGVPTARSSGASSRWCSSTPPTCPRSTGPASSRSTPARRRPRARSGLTALQALRYVVAAAGRPAGDPAAAQRLHRPAEGHRARLVHRRRRGVPRSPDRAGRDVQLHALPRRGARLPRRSRSRWPRFTDWLVARDRRRAGRRRRCGERARRSRSASRACTSRSATLEVLRGIDLDVAEHEVVCLIGASGSRQVDAPALHQPARADRRRPDRASTGAGDHGPGVDVDRVRRRIGIVFQAFNLFPHMTVLDNVTLAPRKVLKLAAAPRPRRARRELLDALRPGGQGATSTPTGSRAASSSGSRSCGRSRWSPTCCCSTRSRARWTRSSWRGARRRPRAGRRRHDDGHRHPRDGLRPRHRRPGLLPRRRRDPRAGAARRRSSASRARSEPAFLQRVTEADVWAAEAHNVRPAVAAAT